MSATGWPDNYYESGVKDTYPRRCQPPNWLEKERWRAALNFPSTVLLTSSLIPSPILAMQVTIVLFRSASISAQNHQKSTQLYDKGIVLSGPQGILTWEVPHFTSWPEIWFQTLWPPFLNGQDAIIFSLDTAASLLIRVVAVKNGSIVSHERDVL